MSMNGMRDKEGVVDINLVNLALQLSWKTYCLDNTIVLWPSRQLLSLFLLTDNSGKFEQWACISQVYLARLFTDVQNKVTRGERSVLEVNLRATGVMSLVRDVFENAPISHIRHSKRHQMRPFPNAVQEKTYNNNPPIVIGTNVVKMIQANVASQHVLFHFVKRPGVPERSKCDLLKTGI